MQNPIPETFLKTKNILFTLFWVALILVQLWLFYSLFANDLSESFLTPSGTQSEETTPKE